MKKFITITTRKDGAIVRSWIDSEKIVQLSQNSVTQAGENEGICVFADGTTIPVIAFDETISSLS
jgi:hypothetical protein